MINTEDKIFVKENAHCMTIDEMYKHFQTKYDKKMLRNYCTQQNIKFKKMSAEERKLSIKRRKLSQYKCTPINYDYFKKWSANMAYIFGLWCADGNIYHNDKNNMWSFSIKLKSEDEYLLQNILNEMSSEHKIYRKKYGASEMNLSCKTIYNDIKNLGSIENKSLRLTFPYVPKEFVSDFIRGYFDGDGSKYTNKTAGSILGTYSFCQSISKILQENDIKVSSITQVHPEKGLDNNCYRVGIYKKDEYIKFEKFMMKNCNENSLYMKRKHQYVT